MFLLGRQDVVSMVSPGYLFTFEDLEPETTNEREERFIFLNMD